MTAISHELDGLQPLDADDEGVQFQVAMSGIGEGVRRWCGWSYRMGGNVKGRGFD